MLDRPRLLTPATGCSHSTEHRQLLLLKLLSYVFGFRSREFRANEIGGPLHRENDDRALGARDEALEGKNLRRPGKATP